MAKASAKMAALCEVKTYKEFINLRNVKTRPDRLSLSGDYNSKNWIYLEIKLQTKFKILRFSLLSSKL